MKTVKIGDILSVRRGIIVHGCNAQGKMGSGLAKAIKEKYPKAFHEYNKLHLNGSLCLGEVSIVEVQKGLYIANAITQEYYGRDKDIRYVSYKAIQQAFKKILKVAYHDDLPVHYPMIGSDLGNGNWAVISEIIDSVFSRYSVKQVLWIKD